MLLHVLLVAALLSSLSLAWQTVVDGVLKEGVHVSQMSTHICIHTYLSMHTYLHAYMHTYIHTD